jgi:pyridoxal phosphate enzyme (YggS family)
MAFINFANIMIAQNISKIQSEIGPAVQLVVVSKYRNIEDIKQAYAAGQRHFAENRVQALLERKAALPNDIHWHLIGHLQSNKVKHIAEFIHCIQSVDSKELLSEIDKQASKHNRIIDCLLQLFIAQEEAKFGMDADECKAILQAKQAGAWPHVNIIGLMGMASLTTNAEQIRSEFSSLKSLYDELKDLHGLRVLSMGMSSDYAIAVAAGSNLIRVGSKVFE